MHIQDIVGGIDVMCCFEDYEIQQLKLFLQKSGIPFTMTHELLNNQTFYKKHIKRIEHEVEAFCSLNPGVKPKYHFRSLREICSVISKCPICRIK
jgi:hypothetical protein